MNSSNLFSGPSPRPNSQQHSRQCIIQDTLAAKNPKDHLQSSSDQIMTTKRLQTSFLDVSALVKPYQNSLLSPSFSFLLGAVTTTLHSFLPFHVSLPMLSWQVRILCLITSGNCLTQLLGSADDLAWQREIDSNSPIHSTDPASLLFLADESGRV